MLATTVFVDQPGIIGRIPRRVGHRLFDLAIAIVALAFFAPLMLLVALAISLGDRGPILFAHRRIGQHGREFKCYKFRTMTVDADQRLAALLASSPAARAEWMLDHKLRQDPRVTWLGRFLRKTSLDELPQFINLLRGDMSVVGPRPIVSGEVHRYGRWFRDYCRVKPGITGLWQVSGRNNTTYRRRVALDVIYSRRCSLPLNIRILAMTVPAVLLQKGSY